VRIVLNLSSTHCDKLFDSNKLVAPKVLASGEPSFLKTKSVHILLLYSRCNSCLCVDCVCLRFLIKDPLEAVAHTDMNTTEASRMTSIFIVV
jgi:hypothetical protein